ncbi:hypothetical protein Vafri_21995, partial [Volvox africanus]
VCGWSRLTPAPCRDFLPGDRLHPLSPRHHMHRSNPRPLTAQTLDYLGPELSKRNLAYVALSSVNGDPYFRFAGLQAPNVNFDLFRHFRPIFKGTLAINGGLGIEQGEQYVSDGVADLVFYGVHFISNANLPELVAGGVRTGGLNMGRLREIYRAHWGWVDV